MKLLKIKDNSQHKKDTFSDISTLTGKIADKTLDQLEREGVFVFPEYIDDAEDITRDQMILQSVNDSYRSGNVMGFIGCGNERLIIESRFSGEEDDYFFQYLIDRVLDFPNLVDLETDANQDNRLFNFLLFLFPYYLKTAMRKGLFKEYIRHNYNDGYVKGTIDIARHIEKNTPFTGNVAYSQREFSYDNSLMELVRHTIEFIKRKPYGTKILVKVKDADLLTLDQILDLSMRNDKGELIVLRNLIDYDRVMGPVNIERKNQERVLTVGGNNEIGLFYRGSRPIIAGIGWELVKRLDIEAGKTRLVNLLTAWKHEIKEMMGGMGINSIEALKGNRLMLRGVGMTDRELEILGIAHAGE